MQISFRSLECGICVLGGTMLICTGYALSLINPGRKKVYIATLKKSKKKTQLNGSGFRILMIY